MEYSSEILNVGGKPEFDDSISRYEYHSFTPYSSTNFNLSDEIRITINQQDIFTLPCESELYFEGKVLNQAGNALTNIELVSNAFAFLLDDIRYELASIEVDSTKNVGITSTIKNYLSCNDYDAKLLENAGWNVENIVDANGNFAVVIPLKMLMGFFEDYRRVLLNIKQELILRRSNANTNCVVKKTPAPATQPDTGAKIDITKVAWRMPFVHVNDREKLALLKLINSNEQIDMSFRSWDLYEFPELQKIKKFNWQLSTSFALERPRYVIIAFQNNRQKNLDKDASIFDHMNLENIKVYLNGESYPYENLLLDFDKNNYALAYSMYVKFQSSYYSKFPSEPLISFSEFKSKAPLFVIDCSRQHETLKAAQVDLRLEIEFGKDPADKTTAYALVIHDKIVQYNALANTVSKLI